MKIHFIGIGGIGLSGLANVYLQKGYSIQGSDAEKTKITKQLQDNGAVVWIGHKIEQISSDIDLVVYSEAVPEDNTELVRAKELSIECLSGAKALAELAKDYFLIAVSGMHGKTTTASMIAKALLDAGLDPTYIIGTKNGSRLGKGKYLVIEADDYQAKLLNYHPDILVLTNIEEEHMDYFKDLDHILDVFRKYISQTKKLVIFNQDDKNTRSAIPHGREEWPNKEISSIGYSLRQKEAEELREVLRVPGEHNVSNALAVLEVTKALGIGEYQALKSLSEYNGTWRRFEEKQIKINNRGVLLISDYAHHPTEIEATLKAARGKYPNKKIWCVFQPHQYQRTHYLFDNFVKVFGQAIGEKLVDKLIITDIYDVAGRENKEIKEKISSEKLTQAISQCLEVKPLNIEYLGMDKIINYLNKNLQGGEVVIIMGAGSVYKLADELSTGSVD